MVENYTYDENGNRKTETNTLRGIANKAYSYSIEDHVITAGADAYQFDADGFLMSKTSGTSTTAYNYSSRGELQSVTKPDGSTISYDHDAMGRRIAKRINGNIVEKYLWKDSITLLAVYDANDNLISRFNYADDRLPVSMEKDGVKYYLLYDQVGSLRAVTDTSGNIVRRIDYDSFGNVISDTNSGLAVPLGFAGGLHDRDVGVVRFGARDYDPSIGKWTAKDPIDFAGGDIVLYGYVGNNPVNLIDPEGLNPILQFLLRNADKLIPLLDKGFNVVKNPPGPPKGGEAIKYAEKLWDKYQEGVDRNRGYIGEKKAVQGCHSGI